MHYECITRRPVQNEGTTICAAAENAVRARTLS